jgi:hypothetical protein
MKSSAFLFAIELKVDVPQDVASFYERTFEVRFNRLGYPRESYIGALGAILLIISKAERDPENGLALPTQIILGVMSAHSIEASFSIHEMPLKRPLGKWLPAREMRLAEDPAGVFVAVGPPIEHVLPAEEEGPSFQEVVSMGRRFVRGRFEALFRRARRSIEHAVNEADYSEDRIRLTDRDLSGYSHVVASRLGLFVANAVSWKRIANGSFFGITVNNNDIYCFQSCGRLRATENRGRIVKFSVQHERIETVDVLLRGLDDGCHQIDFIGEDLFIVDCYNGEILEAQRATRITSTLRPLGKLARQDAMSRYHINSLTGHPDGTIWLLLHNNHHDASEIAVMSRTGALLRRVTLNACAAHNIVLTGDDLEYLICDSARGKVVSGSGIVVADGMMMTRGLALDDAICVIGESAIAPRERRRYASGKIHFFERRNWKLISTLALPGAPTDIRRIDGNDLSITNYLLKAARL